MTGYKIISADDHVFEPPDLWTERAGASLRDQVPRIVRLDDGDWWYCGDIKVVGVAPGAHTGLRFDEPEKLTQTDTFENVLPGAYLPEERVKDMGADGVDVSIIYPSVGCMLYSLQDSGLLTDLCRMYNDWIAEFCQPFPHQLKGIGMLNIDDVQVGVKELQRCAKMGLAGAMISVYPIEGRGYYSLDYEPLWSAAQDLSIPLSLHVGTNRPGPGQEFAKVESFRPSFMCNSVHWVRMSLGDMIFSGVFERYPNLQVGSVEHELSWVPHFLERLDYTYTQRVQLDSWHRYKEDMLPSDYFHRNVFVGFQEDELGIRLRDVIGVNNLQWGSDYPHQESTFPRTQAILKDILADCSEEDKAKIVCENAARVYHLD